MQAEIGVGPWQGPWPTTSDGQPDPRYDVELLADGDRRNVVDTYRYWRHEAIVADLDTRRHDFHVAIENWGHDFNIGSVVRTANAMGAKAFHIIGKRRWNRRGAMVTDRYQHEFHHPDATAFELWARSGVDLPGAEPGEPIPVIGIDNIPGSKPIETYPMPRRCVLVFGQEGPGLTDEMAAACQDVLHIEQFGSTRSINAGAAAAVAMHQWVLRNVYRQN